MAERPTHDHLGITVNRIPWAAIMPVLVETDGKVERAHLLFVRDDVVHFIPRPSTEVFDPPQLAPRPSDQVHVDVRDASPASAVVARLVLPRLIDRPAVCREARLVRQINGQSGRFAWRVEGAWRSVWVSGAAEDAPHVDRVVPGLGDDVTPAVALLQLVRGLDADGVQVGARR